MKIDMSSITEVGNREINEDYIGYTHSKGYYCWIVCDGLGGHDRSEVASKFITDYLIKSFNNSPTDNIEKLKSLVATSNNELLKLQESEGDINTTLTMVILKDNKLTFLHVGDSRIYCINYKKIIYQSKDHSVPQMLYLMGEIEEKDIRGHEDSNRLLKVLGMEWDNNKCDISTIIITENIGIILCTDGFWEYILEDEMIRNYKKSKDSNAWINKMKKVILKRGKKTSMDNYSAFAIKINN